MFWIERDPLMLNNNKITLQQKKIQKGNFSMEQA